MGRCIYIGELTFHSESGFGPFTPPEWYRKFGDMLILPNGNTAMEDGRQRLCSGVQECDRVTVIRSYGEMVSGEAAV